MGRPWGRAIWLLLALAGCEAEPVPAALLHVWRTDAPAYAGRHLEIRKNTVVFGTGPYTSDFHPILGVDSKPVEPGSTLYTIHYRADDGARLQLRVVLTPGMPDLLRIDHLDEVWRAGPEPVCPEKGV